MFVVKCLECGQQKVMQIAGELTDEVCPICGGPGERLEIVAPVEEMLPDSGLIAEMMSKCR